MHPEHLAVLHQYILKNPEVEFFATKYDFKLGQYRVPAKDIMDIKEGTYNFEIFLKGNFLACNICFKLKSQGLKPFEEDPQYAIMEDWMFLLQNLESKQLLIIDRITLTMLDHEDRSMRKEKDIIKRKLSATEWIDINLKLTKSQFNILQAYSFYFCGIHSYIDGQNKEGRQFVMKAIKLVGINLRFLILAIKLLLGRRIIGKLI